MWRWWFGRDIEQTHTCKYAPHCGGHVPVNKHPTPCTCVQGSQNYQRLSPRTDKRHPQRHHGGELQCMKAKSSAKEALLCAYAEASANAKASSINPPFCLVSVPRAESEPVVENHL